jgi:hypothetical protein
VSLPSLPSLLERSSVVFLDEEAELPLPEGVDEDAEEVFGAVEDVAEVDVFLEDLLLLLLDLSWDVVDGLDLFSRLISS